jgi:S-ribosylhomocysteine lyase LuxS involved in autoinducer biosynthesis
MSVVRHHIERIPGVSRTWIEWTSEGDDYNKVLVVEVEFDTDPNSTAFSESTIEAIDHTIADVLKNEPTMVINGLRIVPKGTPDAPRS